MGKRGIKTGSSRQLTSPNLINSINNPSNNFSTIEIEKMKFTINTLTRTLNVVSSLISENKLSIEENKELIDEISDGNTNGQEKPQNVIIGGIPDYDDDGDNTNDVITLAVVS